MRSRQVSSFMLFRIYLNLREDLLQALIMWKVLRSESSEVQDHWRWHSRAIFNFVRYRRVFEAIIQSAAIYSAASISLLVTTLISPNIGLYACLCVFPPLIVRPSAHVSEYWADVAPLGFGVLTHRDSDWTQYCNLKPCLLADYGIRDHIREDSRPTRLHHRPKRLLAAANARFKGLGVELYPAESKCSPQCGYDAGIRR